MSEAFQGLVFRQIRSTDDRTKLSLGDANYTPLKIFLKKTAWDFHQFEIAKTYVLLNSNISPSRIQGYITLMNSEIILNEGQQPIGISDKYEVFPAVKIARLAIDKIYQGQGFGGMLLDWCINHVKRAIMPNVGCRFLVVDAKKDSIPFYQKNGFTLLDTESNLSDPYPLMFFDLYKMNYYSTLQQKEKLEQLDSVPI